MTLGYEDKEEVIEEWMNGKKCDGSVEVHGGLSGVFTVKEMKTGEIEEKWMKGRK